MAVTHPTMARIFEKTGKSPSEIAAAINASPQNVTNWSKRGISKEAAVKISQEFGISVDWILTGNDAVPPIDGQTLESMQIRPVVDEEESELEDDEFEYPHYNEVYVTGGDKELLVLESSTEPSKMKKSIARKAGASMSHTFSYNLDGDSMSPKIMDKACVTADASKKVVKDGKIYVFRHGVMRRTKYLYNRPDGGLLIRSENKEEYPDEIVPKDEMECIEIIGWVYHWCNMEVW